MIPLLWFYLICASLLALLWLRRERFIPLLLVGVDAGMAVSFWQRPETGWVGYLVAINGLGVICMLLARLEEEEQQRLQQNVEVQTAKKDLASVEQRELDMQVQALEERLSLQKELYHSARSLASVMSMESFLNEVRAIVAKFFNCQSTWLLLFGEEGGVTVRDMRHGSVAALGPFEPGFCEGLRQIRDVVFKTDQASSLEARELPGPHSPWIAVPLVHQQQVWGALVWFDVEPAGPRRGQAVLDQVEVMSNLQHQFELSLSRVLLYGQTEQLSRTDPLTEISKRWYFMQRLNEEAERCVHRRDSLALVMVDIDHFKLFNDRYGHLVGDQVLRATAAKLRSSLRLGDLVCRYGGEEFLLALPSTSEEFAAQAAERICAGIEALEFEVNGEFPRITVSLGVAAFTTDSEDIEETINNADRMLYRAKWLGRNRTCVYSRDGEADVGAPDSV